MKNLICAVMMLAICSCANRPTMSVWLGHKEDAVLSKWGAPDSTVNTNEGKRIHTWKYPKNDGNGNFWHCRRSLTINKDGIISYWAYDGCSGYLSRHEIP